jgi:hypothetical protein
MSRYTLAKKSLFIAIFLNFSAFYLVAQSIESYTPQIIQPADCQNIIFPGTITGDQVINKGDTPGIMFETDPATGGSGELRYLWMEYLQVGSFPGQWYPILSATSSSFQPGALHKTTKFMRCVSREKCNQFIESNTVTIIVKDTEI